MLHVFPKLSSVDQLSVDELKSCSKAAEALLDVSDNRVDDYLCLELESEGAPLAFVIAIDAAIKAQVEMLMEPVKSLLSEDDLAHAMFGLAAMQARNGVEVLFGLQAMLDIECKHDESEHNESVSDRLGDLVRIGKSFVFNDTSKLYALDGAFSHFPVVEFFFEDAEFTDRFVTRYTGFQSIRVYRWELLGRFQNSIDVAIQAKANEQ